MCVSYKGHVVIWNYVTGTLVKSIEVSDLPVRAAKFVARKQWVVCGADDMYVRVYNYNTMDKVKTFEAHTDYIRSIAVHPTAPLMLTSSDDMLIKLWDWEKGWQCSMVFEGHAFYVMQVVFNPKDANTFASCSLDRTIKVWNLGSPVPNFTLDGHEKGVNCVDYFSSGDRPYIISGADDKLVKIWDYQTKSCVQTLEGHTHNISAACFHPELPIIITGSEDGTLRIWHSATYRLENTLNYGLERAWSVSVNKGSNRVAIGYDEGAVMIQLGREEPVASMDQGGKIMWAKHNEVHTANIKSLSADIELADGERVPLAIKDLGTCDLYPQSLRHNPNGRFVAVCGDGEYIIYTAVAWRNKSYGNALEFVWGTDSNDAALRESTSTVKLLRNFNEKAVIRPAFAAEAIYGGALLAIRSADFVCFYDWDSGKVIRRIDVPVKDMYWNDSGELLTIVSDSSFYVLRFSQEAVIAHLEGGGGGDDDEEGVEDAFDLLDEISDVVRSGFWVGDCFVYNTASWRLNYYVGGEVTTMFHLDKPMYLLGYYSPLSRIFLIDRDYGIYSFTLLLQLIEYKTLVMRGDEEAAAEVLPTIPAEQMNNVAKFLESRGDLTGAMAIATDPDYKFELAIQVGELETASAIAETSSSEAKWKQLGELSMALGNFGILEKCLTMGKDLSGLLLYYSSTGDRAGMERVGREAVASGRFNVAFTCLFSTGDLDGCVDLLVNAGRIPEAAFFARTYIPSRMGDLVKLWREDLKTVNKKAAESLADPAEFPNLFPDLELAMRAESDAERRRGAGAPASDYPRFEGAMLVEVLEEMRNMSLGNGEAANGDVVADEMANGGEEELGDMVEDDGGVGEEEGGDMGFDGEEELDVDEEQDAGGDDVLDEDEATE